MRCRLRSHGRAAVGWNRADAIRVPLVRLFIIFTRAAGDRVTYFLFVLAQVGGPIHWRWDEHCPFIWPRGRHGLSIRHAVDRKCRFPPFHLHPVVS